MAEYEKKVREILAKTGVFLYVAERATTIFGTVP